MATAVTTFLMFEGRAEEAITFYVSLFADGQITSLTRYGPEEQGPAGQVSQAFFVLGGHEFRAFDSPVPHAFTFTPAMSIFVDCENEPELERLYAALAEGGQALMALGDYGFSRRFGWLQDRFGVSWQLNLPHG